MAVVAPLVNLWNFAQAVEIESPFSGACANGAAVGYQKLDTDAIGMTNVEFDGVQPGSEIHVYLPDGTELAGVENCGANQTLSWPVFAPGSPNNTVYITIIKRGLRWQRFNYVSKAGNQAIPIFPQPDLAYSNPA